MFWGAREQNAYSFSLRTEPGCDVTDISSTFSRGILFLRANLIFFARIGSVGGSRNVSEQSSGIGYCTYCNREFFCVDVDDINVTRTTVHQSIAKKHYFYPTLSYQ